MTFSAEWVTAAGTAMAGLATFVAGWAAVRGVDAWRSEIVGRRKAELAEDVLAQFIMPATCSSGRGCRIGRSRAGRGKATAIGAIDRTPRRSSA